MALLAMTWNPYLIGLVTVLFLAVCVLMVLTVLIQKPQGGGLSGAFGSGAGSGQTAFGTKTGDALTIFTIIVFVIYLIFAIVLNFAARPQAQSATTTNAQSTPAPNTPPAGAPAAPADQKPDQKPADGAQPAAN